MKKLIAMTLLLGGSTLLCAQKTVKIPAVYKPVKSEMYTKIRMPRWMHVSKICSAR